MKENRYDDKDFFEKYSSFPRSVEGLCAAGEWHKLREMLPSLAGKRLLDLGCGFGWHCIYAAEQGAEKVVGVDISDKMLAEARKKTTYENVSYVKSAIEELVVGDGEFHVVLSSLAFHYISDFPEVVNKVYRWLKPGGTFVFSVEHPVFTAYGSQDWYYNDGGEKLHWPVDHYFTEGERSAIFLDTPITKYHRTLTSYVGNLLDAGFILTGVAEPMPEQRLLDSVPEMSEELRRPMMLIISGRKPE